MAAWAWDGVAGAGLQGGYGVEAEGADGDGLRAWDLAPAHTDGADFELDVTDELQCWGVCVHVVYIGY